MKHYQHTSDSSIAEILLNSHISICILCPHAASCVCVRTCVHMYTCKRNYLIYRNPTVFWNWKMRLKNLFLSKWIDINVNIIFYQWAISTVHLLGCNSDKKHRISIQTFKSLLYHYLCNWIWKNWGAKKLHYKVRKSSLEIES